MTGEIHPGSHPDADSLSAFVEGVLPEHERQQCLAHFAECAECREAVFLARQQATAVPTPKEAPFWHRWLAPVPVLSGAVAVCALAVAMFLYVFHTLPARRNGPIAQVTRARQNPSTSVGTGGVSHAVSTMRPSASGPGNAKPAVPPAGPSQPREADAAAPLRVQVAHTDTLNGVVTDVSNAVVPDAKIVLKDEASQTTRETVSNGSGIFRFDGVPPGYYTLKVSAAGFVTWEEKGIPLSAEQAGITVPNVVLQVGGTKSEVAVVAANDIVVPADTGQTSTTLNSHMITQLSLAGRDAAELIKVMPGTPVPARLSLNQVTLVLDAAGGLRLSQDGGRDWEAVTPVWQGKVVRLAILVAPEPAVSRPVFAVTTDSGAMWFSLDGTRWSPAPAR